MIMVIIATAADKPGSARGERATNFGAATSTSPALLCLRLLYDRGTLLSIPFYVAKRTWTLGLLVLVWMVSGRSLYFFRSVSRVGERCSFHALPPFEYFFF